MKNLEQNASEWVGVKIENSCDLFVVYLNSTFCKCEKMKNMFNLQFGLKITTRIAD